VVPCTLQMINLPLYYVPELYIDIILHVAGGVL
jgi:hypothetical protein